MTKIPKLDSKLLKNKSFIKVLPTDSRNYSEDTYEFLSKNYTFKPVINKSTVFDNLQVVEEQKKFRQNFELNKSSGNYSLTHQ